ncbi:MAG: creatininase family protein [Anaerolineales bacterium]
MKYGDLTWPEVAALPRDTTLVLPLGSGYNPEEVGRQIGDGPQCWLPALPYGWTGSMLPVASEVFERALAGILSAPFEEGFQRLVVLCPSDRIGLPASVEPLVVPEPSGAGPRSLPLDRERVVLIPVGHTEQHGLHLPMNTDSLIIDAIAQGVVDQIPEESLALPTLPYGVSTHRKSFAGTFNMGGRAFEDFQLAVIGRLIEAGADRIYFMSGHGGNVSFLVNVVKYAGERFPAAFIATAYLHTSGKIGVRSLEQYRRSKRGGMGHACELETSLMLHLRPDLCHMQLAVDEIDFIATENYYMDWVEGGELIANPPWEDDTQTGAYGAGSLATAENGARWLSAAIEEKVAHVREIHEQQDRRLARRGRSG